MTDGRIQQFYEAINSGLEDVIRQMLDANPSLVTVETEQRGGTPLHSVSLTGEVGIVELLIARGAKLNAEDANGFTPLQLAASVGNAEVIRILLRNGADVLAGRDHGRARLPFVDAEGSSAIRGLVATMIEHQKMLKHIVETTDPDTPERNLILETVQPTYSDPEQTVFALALTEARQAGVFDTLAPLITSVKEVRGKLYDLSIEWKRSRPPLGAWNDAFLLFNDAINMLIDYVPAVEDALQKKQPENKNAKAIAQFPSPPDLQWGDVTIEFVSNDSVKVSAGGTSERYTFAEIGFKDKRRGDRPDSRWQLLRQLGGCGGTLSWDTHANDAVRPGAKTAIKDIRKRLKAFMGIADDPFKPYRQMRAYVPKFTLRARSDE
jgi:hypothetical protein